MGLEDKINLMNKYYMKGFGNIVYGVLVNSAGYLNDGEDRDLVLEELDMIEKHYASIDFEEHDSNSDFAPLFVTRDLLKLYCSDAREFLEKPDADKLEGIRTMQIALHYVGEVYRANLLKRLGELRKIEGYESFRLEQVDYKGAHFFV